jgi:pyrimidine deaminase RibD-like protein
VTESFLNEASSDEAWELVGQPVPEIRKFVKQMGYGKDERSVEKITPIIDRASSTQIPAADIPKLKNLANKGNDAQTLKAVQKISGRPDAEQQYIKLMQARDADEGRKRDITGYIQYVKSGNYDPPVLLKLPTGLYVIGGRTRLYAALALGVPANVKIISADNFKQGVAESREITKLHKLDSVLEKCIEMIHRGHETDPDKYGRVAACLIDNKNNHTYAINMPGPDGTRRHAERMAIDKHLQRHGRSGPNAIMITTLSPCVRHMDERDGESCTDLLSDYGIEKCYAGWQDPTQHPAEDYPFNLQITDNADIFNTCRDIAASFLPQAMAEGTEQITWTKPNFDYEWHEVEEQSRMEQVPVDVRQYYQKHFPNKDAWIQAVQHGRAVVVPPDHTYEIRNSPPDKASLQKVLAPTGHEGPIGPAKKKRVDALFAKGGPIEMPIVLKTSKGLWLIGGKTRLGTANYIKGIPAKVWVIGGKKDVAENFADGRNPQDKGDSKRHHVPTKSSVSNLRKFAKSHSGRAAQLAHWMANMKSGRAKKK